MCCGPAGGGLRGWGGGEWGGITALFVRSDVSQVRVVLFKALLSGLELRPIARSSRFCSVFVCVLWVVRVLYLWMLRVF